MRTFFEGGIFGLSLAFLAVSFVLGNLTWLGGVLTWAPPDRAFLMMVGAFFFGIAGAIAKIIESSRRVASRT